MSTTGSASQDSLDAQQILDTARSATHPADWFVWPLRRDRARRAVLEAAGTALFGFIVLIPLFLATVPGNFQRGVGSAFVTSVLLLLVGAVAFGGLWLLVVDLLRLARADQYLLVMTPTDYVKAEPGRVTHVPMASVGYVTLKGVKGASPPSPAPQPPAPTRVGPLGSLGNLGTFRRQPGRAPTLAFLDLRTDREVVVGTDNSFDELGVLHEILSSYAGGTYGGPPRTR